MYINKILLIIHNFLPISLPESYLSAKALGSIPNSEVDVLTIKSFSPLVRKDNSLDSYVKENFNRVTVIPSPTWYQKLPFHKLKFFFSIPDEYLWLNFLYKPYFSSIKKYDCLITWSTYHSSHLVGYSIKKKFPNISWITHLSDPWVDNPFNNYGNFTRKINQYFERKVFEKADAITFTSANTQDLIMKNYSSNIREKSNVIPHCYENKFFKFNNRKNNKITFSYLGNFYGKRTPEPLLKAIDQIRIQNPKLLNNIFFNFYGSQDEISQDIIDKFNFSERLVKFNSPISYIKSLEKMQQADILLIIDAAFEKSVFLPSKLIDYLGSKTPILGISPDGTTKDLLKSIGYKCIHPNDTELIKKSLMYIINNYDKYHNRNFNHKLVNSFNSVSIGRKRENLISNLLSQK